MKINKVLTTGLVLALAGCDNSSDKPKTQNLAGEYQSRPIVTQQVEKFSQLEGKIVKVQPSQLSFIGRYLGIYGGNTAAWHEFEYVIVEGQDGRTHTLIYPYSKAILERDATIKFRPLNSGMIDAETFIYTFLNPEYFTEDNIIIEAEGLITKDGIQYK